ncbi:MAG: cell division protein SepF [Candidatus Aenigmatarchaeota archaeon]|nr:MAG: cell division protein SepF [Candidatus Aenigmarchaeota archaeon]
MAWDFLKREASEDDFVEVEHHSAHDASSIPIRIAKINDYADVEPVQKMVREGNIVFVKIKGLKDKDMSELKRAVERLRKTVMAINGDIAGVDENFVIITPNFARVDRSEPGQAVLGPAPGPAAR